MSVPQPENQALVKLRANEVVKLYVTGNFASPRHVDFICRSGVFDALWFDLEHFDLSTQDVAMLNLVMRGFPVTTIARFKAADYQSVMRILETGIGGIMCSMVNSAAEARQIVQWAKFNNPNPSPGEATGMGARLICPGGDVKVKQLGVRELARTFERLGQPAGVRPMGVSVSANGAGQTIDQKMETLDQDVAGRPVRAE